MSDCYEIGLEKGHNLPMCFKTSLPLSVSMHLHVYVHMCIPNSLLCPIILHCDALT